MANVFVDRDASSCDALLAVRIPLFAIHAEDDPVSPAFQRLTRFVLMASRLLSRRLFRIRKSSKIRSQSYVPPDSVAI